MKLRKTNLKQGTLEWEKARETRIGGSEIFDIVRYYSTNEELQNCGIDAEKFKAEKPNTTAWALYHKLQNDGIYEKQELPPELAEYGHAMEPVGIHFLSHGRERKLSHGKVFASDRLIASLDVSGISETVDEHQFDYGAGAVKKGKKFVCEQKTMMPAVLKNGIPFKYIVQAQYQLLMTGADFYILQIMVIKNDTPFERGKIVQMSLKKRIEYLKDKLSISNVYFQNNEHLAMLIATCLDRFFKDVDEHKEPTPFIAYDTQRNIIESIRLNTFYNKDLTLDYDLSDYDKAKKEAEEAEERRKAELQKIIEAAKKYNASRFNSEDATGSFSTAGAFLLKRK